MRITNYKLRATNHLLFAICYLLFASSCGIYSFTGTSIPPDVETFSIGLFKNQADIVVPTLGQDMTLELRNKMNNQTNLNAIDRDGDFDFQGTITKYSVQSIAPTGAETAAQNRLTISVKVDFKNNKNDKENWTETFSKFQDYDGAVNLSDVEEQLNKEIVDQLIQEIFNKAVVNW